MITTPVTPDYESNARTYSRAIDVTFTHSKGNELIDDRGRTYIDFLTGAGTVTLGHGHEKVVEAVKAQLDVSVTGLDLRSPLRDEFARAQLAQLPEGMRDRTKVHFCGPSGSDAVEAAIKLCRSATGRPGIVAFRGAYHGSTAGALAVSASAIPKRPGDPMTGDVQFVPYAHCTDCPVGLDPTGCDTNCAAVLESMLRDSHRGVPLPAAVIVELVQGEGGAHSLPAEFVHRLREVTSDLGVMLIVDEIQTGCGRTGTWFAFEQAGIEPDVVLLSKGLTGIGLPISVMLFDRDLDLWEPGAHIGTYRGHHLAMAAGLATLRAFEDEDVLENVRQRSEQAFAFAEGLRESCDLVDDVRGAGLLIGIELRDPAGATPGATAATVQRACLDAGLIVERGGRSGRVLRPLPALNVGSAVMDRALEILGEAVTGLSGEEHLEGMAL